MSFLNPAMLLGLLAAAVPILIHLIHRQKPRRQTFAALEFVLRSIQRVERRFRLKRFLLLASRITILAAFALAAARPLLGSRAEQAVADRGPERLALVIDASLSMRAVYEERSAFDRARTLARNLIENMGPQDQALVVFARRKPQLAVERPTADRAALERAVSAAEPSYEAADLAEAISVAAEALRPAEGAPEAKDGPRVRIVALTDLAGHAIVSPAELAIDARGTRAQLELVSVLEGQSGDEQQNRGISELEITPVPGGAPRTVSLRARIRAYAESGGRSEPVPIVLADANGELERGSVEVAPGTLVDKKLEHAFPEAGHVPIEVRLSADRLAEDDVRYAIADVRRTVRSLIVDGAPSGVPKEDEAFYLERALLAGAPDQPSPVVTTGDDLDRIVLSDYDVVILAGVSRLGVEEAAHLVRFVEAGGGLMMTMTDGMDLELLNTQLGSLLPRRLRGPLLIDPANGGEPLALETPDPGHPVTSVFVGEAAFGLTSARSTGLMQLEPSAREDTQILLSFSDGAPALITRSVGRGHVLLLTTTIDRDWTDLPIRPGFVPLMRRALLFLGQALTPVDTRRTLVGEVRSIRLPEGTSALVVDLPNGERIEFDEQRLGGARELAFAETALPGHYRVRATIGAAEQPLPDEDFAVNVDPRESDLRPISNDEAQAVLAGTASAGGNVSSKLAELSRMGLENPNLLAGLLLSLLALAFLGESLLTASWPERKPRETPRS